MKPVVWGTSLYSYLVTRHTGRAVRLSIESQIAACEGRVVAVLDFRNVVVIDFSCADEVVAKLVHVALAAHSRPRDLFLFFRGVEEHHLDPIECALDRRSVAVAAERSDGQPCLLGSTESGYEKAWTAMCSMGHATPEVVAACMGATTEEARSVLDELHARRLVFRDDDIPEYVSLHQLVRELAPLNRPGS